MDHSSEGRIVVAVQRTLDNSYSLACRQGEPGGSGLGDQAALTVLEATVCLIRVLRAELAAARIQIDRAPWVVSPRLPEPPRTCTTTLPSYPSCCRPARLRPSLAGARWHLSPSLSLSLSATNSGVATARS
jgi:hypothetical protein